MLCCSLDLLNLKQCQMAVFCEQGNKPSCSVLERDVFVQMNHCQLSK
jgi:hypothetical protein